MTVGENIKRIRKEKGFTQDELGNLVNISGVAIMRYEKGQREPRQDTLIKIAKALGVHLRDLVDTSIWEEFDKQHPGKGEEAAEFEDFIKFLKSIGYMVKTVPESDTYWVKLSKDGATTTFSQEAFENFQLETKKSVDFQVWQKNQEKK